MTNIIAWSRSKFQYLINGRLLGLKYVTASADAVRQELLGRISVVATRTQNGEISLDESYAEMQRLTKLLVVTQKALARGGWDNMRPSDYKQASADVLELWEGRAGDNYFHGLRRIYEDAHRGFFGPDLRQRGFNATIQKFANAAHSLYENERLAMHAEMDFVEAERVLAASDHCPTCLREGGKRRKIKDVVKISDSECRFFCRCTMIFFRLKDAILGNR